MAIRIYRSQQAAARRDRWRVLTTILIGIVAPLVCVLTATASIWGNWYGGDIALGLTELVIAGFLVFLARKALVDRSADLNASLWCMFGLIGLVIFWMTAVIVRSGSAMVATLPVLHVVT